MFAKKYFSMKNLNKNWQAENQPTNQPTNLCSHIKVPIEQFQMLSYFGKVDWFYGMQTLIALFNAEVSIFTCNCMVSGNW